jgi:hypothetical protein
VVTTDVDWQLGQAEGTFESACPVAAAADSRFEEK